MSWVAPQGVVWDENQSISTTSWHYLLQLNIAGPNWLIKILHFNHSLRIDKIGIQVWHCTSGSMCETQNKGSKNCFLNNCWEFGVPWEMSRIIQHNPGFSRGPLEKKQLPTPGLEDRQRMDRRDQMRQCVDVHEYRKTQYVIHNDTNRYYCEKS